MQNMRYQRADSCQIIGKLEYRVLDIEQIRVLENIGKDNYQHIK
jgi:hypothetical protein